MSKKRESAEASTNEQTDEGSDPVLQQGENNAKRAKLTPPSDTTLQDLPTELIECILVKVVAMEVQGWHLAKSAWKEKEDLAISRLSTVCSQWSSILSTAFFRNELHRALDGIAQETIRLEMLDQSRIGSKVTAMTALNDELYMLYELSAQECVIRVYGRNNMARIKDVIPLPGTNPVSMAACSVSNCVYVALRNNNRDGLTVLRITKDVKRSFNISPWLTDHRRPISMISVSANGNLVILSVQRGQGATDVVSIYDANGTLHQEIMFTPDDDLFSYANVFQKPTGNIVLAYIYQRHKEINLLEVDTSGSVVRKYQSSARDESYVNVADMYGRIMIADPWGEGIELLDSEFNHLGTYSWQHFEDMMIFDTYDLHYESEGNEIVLISYDEETKYKRNVLTRFRFTCE